MAVEFVRFEDFGFGLVAVLRANLYPFIDDYHIRLSADSLRERIKNLREYGVNVNTEMAVLAEMMRRSKLSGSITMLEDQDDANSNNQLGHA